MRKSFKFTIVALLVTGTIGTFIFARINRQRNDIISNWSITLPSPNKVIYSKNNFGWPSDGEIYHIFQYNDNKKIIKLLEWNDGRNFSMESKVLRIIETLGVPEENIPNFQGRYKYFKKIKDDNSTLYIIYFDDIKRLYIIQNYM